MLEVKRGGEPVFQSRHVFVQHIRHLWNTTRRLQVRLKHEGVGRRFRPNAILRIAVLPDPALCPLRPTPKTLYRILTYVGPERATHTPSLITKASIQCVPRYLVDSHLTRPQSPSPLSNPPLKPPAAAASTPVLTTCHLTSNGLGALVFASNRMANSFGTGRSVSLQRAFVERICRRTDAEMLTLYCARTGHRGA